MTDLIEDGLVELRHPSLVPEIPLYTADHILTLWRTLNCEAPPYWAFAWPGGQALARYTLDNPDRFRGATVLDIGPGTGINSIAAALAGAEYVVAADNQPLSLELTQINTELNIVSSRIEVRDAVPVTRDFDIVLFGDCFYEYEMALAMLDMADDAIRFGRTVLVGDPRREYLPLRRCRPLTDYVVPDTMMLERRPRTPAYAFELVGND